MSSTPIRKATKWLTAATPAAAVIRLLVPVLASLLANGDPLVALCAAVSAELGLASKPLSW